MTRTALAVSMLFLAAVRAAAADPAVSGWWATVTEVTGLARIRAGAGAEWTVPAAGARLDPGGTILTLEGGRARLEFSDGTRTSLAPNSRLTVAAPEGPRRRLSLLTGFLRIVAAKLAGGAELELTTPTAIAAVKGTDFTLAVSDAVTEIAVLEGEVLCADRARRYQVLMRAGESARWDRNGLWRPVGRLTDDETAGLKADEPRAAPAGLQLGGYVVAQYHAVTGGGAGFSNPWLGVSPVSPLEIARGKSRSGFSAPWLGLAASSPLAAGLHTFWELMVTQYGANQFPGTDDHHGTFAVLQGWIEADGPLAGLTWRAGILPVPVGRLNQDPAPVRRAFASFPVYAIHMVPVPWSDVGVQASFGSGSDRLSWRAEVAAVNGLQVERDDGWQWPRIQMDGLWWARPSADERSFGRDNNRNVALAGRAGVSLGRRLTVGGFGYRGKAMRDNTGLMTLLGADLGLEVEALGCAWTLRSEVARWESPWDVLDIAGGFAELVCTPAGWPVSVGVGSSSALHRANGITHGEQYATIAWRLSPAVTLKAEGQRWSANSDFGSEPDASVLVLQAAAFW